MAALAGEEDQAALVLLETGDVGGERFLRDVLAAGVNGDADCGSELAGDASLLQLLEGETAASSRAAVVFDGRASHNGTKLVDWARSNSSGLGQTGLTTAVLASGLYNS